MTMVDYKDIWIYFLANHKKIFNQSRVSFTGLVI